MPADPKPLEIGRSYSRADLARIFNEPSLSTHREGWFPRDSSDYVPFFVTLDKAHADPSVRYNDYFEDNVFLWESQNNLTHQSKWIRKVVQGEVTPMLFVRERAKVRNVTQKFVYAGRLADAESDRESSKPVKFAFDPIDLPSPLPPTLVRLVEWKPDIARRSALGEEFKKTVEKQKGRTKGQNVGYQSDPKVRKAIELHAMDRARRAYEKHGYDVTDVSGNSPYDLYCTKDGVRPRRVEVKGTTGNGESVLLTIGEVLAAREAAAITDLFVVSCIEVELSADGPKAHSGKARVIQGWSPADEDLKATQFSYTLPVT